jgi:tRNA (guanine37-N1)-methyltransferase
MRFDIITIFPKIFDSYFSESILKRAQKKGLIKIGMHDLRRWTIDKHKTVDDSPYGGGPGMIFKIEPIYKAVQFLSSKFKVQSSKLQSKSKKLRVILFSAKGKLFTQEDARRLAKYDRLILICGRYEGVDERVAEYIADEELSVGNFVLTGGEIPAMIVVDTVSRQIPGVLGKKESLEEESHSKVISDKGKVISNVEYPQYTRPENFRGWKVPKVLLSGNHKKIKDWRDKISQKIPNS